MLLRTALLVLLLSFPLCGEREALAQTSDSIHALLRHYPPAETSPPSLKSHCARTFLLDSSFYYRWLAGEGNWSVQQSCLYTYDSQGNLRRLVVRYPSQEGWTEKHMSLYIRDQEGYSLIQLELSFNSETACWDTLYRILKRSSSTGYLLESVSENYEGGEWQAERRNTYSYDGAGHLLSEVYFTRNDTGWLPIHRYLHSWGETLELSSLRQNYDTVTHTWLNRKRTQYAYDEAGHRIFHLLQRWDSTSEEWLNETLIHYEWDAAGRLTLQLYQTWDDGEWEDLVRYLYRYDRSDTTDIVMQLWSGSLWKDQYRYLYAYDDCGNLLSDTGMEREGDGWRYEDRRVYYYSLSPLKPPLEVAIIDSSYISCYGSSDGWAMARARGGTPPYRWLWDNDPPSHDSLATGLEAGRWYHVTVTDQEGHTASDSVWLISPEPVITGNLCGPRDVCLYHHYCYCVKPAQEGYYEWSASGGEILGYPTGPYASVRWTRPGRDTLFVVRYDLNGCRGDTSFLVVETFTTSVREVPVTVEVWPNPATNVLHLTVPENGSFSCRLLSPTGRTLLGRECEHPTVTLELPPLPRGIYFLEIRSQERYIVKKILIH